MAEAAESREEDHHEFTNLPSDIKKVNFLKGVMHDDLVDKFKEIMEHRGAVTAENFDDLLPRLTANLEQKEDPSKLLSANELRILGLVLAKYLPSLKANGLDIENAKPGQYTKEQIVERLRSIGQDQLALLLGKKRGIQNLQSEVYRDVYINALMDPQGFTVDLQILKMILCGVPRSGKSTFWKRLVSENFDTEKISQSTILAEHHYIHVSVKSATFAVSEIDDDVAYDWHLCSEDDGSNSSIHKDLDKEALVIYKKILETRSANILTGRQPETDAAAVVPAPITRKQKLPSESSDVALRNVPETRGLRKVEMYKIIDQIFDRLEDRLTSAEEVPDINGMSKMFNLIDTGGQRAFLELMPVLTIGKALYLIFFSYGDYLIQTLQDKYQGESEAFSLDNHYNQLEVILQSLRCVSTTTFLDDALIEKKDADVTALLVGTHTDKPSDQPDIDGSVDNYIQGKVKGFIESDILEYAKPRQLVLRVNNKTENEAEFKAYRELLMQVVDRKFTDSVKKLPGAWLMFSIIARKMKHAGYSVLLYEHCEYIASKLFIPSAALESLLYFMHKDLGILMYFPEVPCLKRLVICDPATVFTSISEIIIKTFIEDVAKKSKTGIKQSHWFTEYAVFSYQTVNQLTKKKRKSLELDTLLVLLQHTGIIAPVEFTKPDPALEFKCTLDHDHQEDSLHCIHSEYIIPCVLRSASIDEQRRIEEHYHGIESMIAPLIITFQCNFAPMGGFCYLFTKLITDQRENGWSPHLPDVNSPDACPVDRIFRRNKITFVVRGKVFVTLLSTAQCYKVYVEHRQNKNQLGYEFICYEVRKAIEDVLTSCLNSQVRDFNIAFQCKGHKEKTDSEHDEHLMIFRQHSNKSTKIVAICERDNAEVNVMDTYTHALMVWLQGPIRLVTKPLSDQLNSIDDKVPYGGEIKLTVDTAPGFKCTFQWKRINGRQLDHEWDDRLWCTGATSQTLHFKHFCKEYEGVYVCTVTDDSDEDYSESFAVKLMLKAPKEFDIKLDDENFYAYLNAKGLSPNDIECLKTDNVNAESFSEKTIPSEITKGGKRLLEVILKGNTTTTTTTSDDGKQVNASENQVIYRPQILLLGGVLGLDLFKLEKMQTLPDDMVRAWLRKQDNVIEKSGDPLTWSALVKALQRIDQRGIANNILRDKCVAMTT